MTETSATETAVAAGPVTFLVEHRTVGAGSGPTIRVVGADDSHEYLRFDMFSEGPHYHYSPPTTPDSEATERILKLDTVADGEAVAWAITTLRSRLAPMLEAAGGERLAAELDDATVGRAVDEVETLARSVQAERVSGAPAARPRAAAPRAGRRRPTTRSSSSHRVGGVEAVDGGEHLLDVEPVLRAVEHRLAHDEVLRSEDRDRVGAERHRTAVLAHRLVERVVGEEQVDRRASPPAADLSLARGRSGRTAGSCRHRAGRARAAMSSA